MYSKTAISACLRVSQEYRQISSTLITARQIWDNVELMVAAPPFRPIALQSPAAGGTTAECPYTARADRHHTTNQINEKCRSKVLPSRSFSMLCRTVDELKPHGSWLETNTVAFFDTPLSFLRLRFSLRSRSFTWARLKSSFDATSGSLCAVGHLFSVDIPTPRSSATCFSVSPRVSAMRVASWWNSAVCFSSLSGSCFALPCLVRHNPSHLLQ